MRKKELTAAYVRECLEYNLEDGVFTWRKRPLGHFKNERAHNSWNARFSGRRAGALRNDGYVHICIDYRYYLAQRIAWMYVVGEWPIRIIDHDNLDGSDNRWVNLREASHSQNGANRMAQRNNTSGIKGVYWFRQTKKWHARIQIDGFYRHLGYFSSKAAAAEAYEKAAIELYGEFARFDRSAA